MKESRGTKTAFAIAAGIVRPVMNLMIGRTWRNFEKLPSGGFIVCPNHVTEIDPLVIGHAIYSSKRYPRYLAKESLFKVPVLGALLRATGQVPVARTSAGASQSLTTAREVLDANGVIIIYAEGTLTRDPDLWPMRGHTGAARLALQTGAPVIPMAHWGAQDLFPRYAKIIKLFPRRHVTVIAGDPVDLDDLRELPLTRTVLTEATARIMRAIADDVAILREEKAPEILWDPADHGQAAQGRNFGNGSSSTQSKESGS